MGLKWFYRSPHLAFQMLLDRKDNIILKQGILWHWSFYEAKKTL